MLKENAIEVKEDSKLPLPICHGMTVRTLEEALVAICLCCNNEQWIITPTYQ